MSAVSIPAVADTTIDKMFTEGTLRGELRLFDFTRDFDEDTRTNHDTSLGGLFYYNTASVNGISFGTSFASSNTLWPSDSDGVYGLVGRDSEGKHDDVNRLQEYFIQGEWFDTKFKYGAQELRTPMMNPHDIRAIPRTFRGFSAVNNSFDNLTLSAIYVTDSMGWSDNSFVSVKEAVEGDLRRAGVVDDVDDNPVYGVGAKYNIPTDVVKASANIWHYRMEDVYNQTYVKFEIAKQLGDVNLYFKPSYLSQESSGDETAGSLDTYQYGAHLGAKFAGADVTFMYAKTGDDTILAPWGDDKVVIQQVYQSARAEEEVYAVRVGYDFGKLGVNGLTAYTFYGEYDAPESTGSDFNELDFSVSYSLDNVLKGLSVRARHAIVDFDNGEDLNDTRFYLKYKFQISGL